MKRFPMQRLPASTGYPLNPADSVYMLKANLEQRGPVLYSGTPRYTAAYTQR